MYIPPSHSSLEVFDFVMQKSITRALNFSSYASDFISLRPLNRVISSEFRLNVRSKDYLISAMFVTDLSMYFYLFSKSLSVYFS